MQEGRVLQQGRGRGLDRLGSMHQWGGRRGRGGAGGQGRGGGTCARGQTLRSWGRGGMAGIGCCRLIPWRLCRDETKEAQKREQRLRGRLFEKRTIFTWWGFVLQGLLSVVHVPGKTVSCHLNWIFLSLFPEAEESEIKDDHILCAGSLWALNPAAIKQGWISLLDI